MCFNDTVIFIFKKKIKIIIVKHISFCQGEKKNAIENNNNSQIAI